MVSPQDVPAVLGSLCWVRLAQDRIAEAVATGQDAVSRYQAMQSCAFFRTAFVLLGHAEALEAAGDHTAACTAIGASRARLLEVAERVADPDYRTAFLEAVPENARTLALASAWL
jgi:hypothetical protein